MYFFKTPKILKFLLKDCFWEITTEKKEIFLTFDDGPIPEITPWVLKTLHKYNAKATFFCTGSNVRLHPRIYQNIIEQGHRTGNHTFHHANGWLTPSDKYIENVEKAGEWIESDLFRPPYGKLTFKQYKTLKKKYTIVMWDVISGDFDPEMTAGQCLNQLKKNVKSGSIVVFHDSLKASKILMAVLPEIMDYWKEKGFTFNAIP